MSYFADAVKEVCRRLDEARIPYMISGSTAANLYTQPRATNDVDIVIQIEVKRAGAVLDAFKNDFYVSEEAVRDAFGGIGMFNIIHHASVTKFDLILLKGDQFSQTAFGRRIRETFEDATLWFISLEDLVLQKLLWHQQSGSELQREDVRRLIVANRERLDERYCLQWAKHLGLEEKLRACL